jgi:hypothetical protein
MREGAVNMANVVSSESVVDTQSSSFEDIPGMALDESFDQPSSELIVLFSAEIAVLNPTARLEIRALDGDTELEPGRVTVLARAQTAQAGAFHFFRVNTPPGVRTVRMQWRMESSNPNVGSVRMGKRTLIVTRASVAGPVGLGFLNVRDFGARGDGVADDTVAIQAAVDTALAQLRHTTSKLDQNVLCGPRVYFPSGVYKISDEISVPDYLDVYAQYGTQLWQANDAKTALRIGNFHNTISGLMFVGGRNAITLNGFSAHYGGNLGTNTAGGENWLRNVRFRYQQGPSIYQDPHVENRGTSAGLILDGFDFVGSCLFWGVSDQFTARHGFVLIGEFQYGSLIGGGPNIDRAARFDNGNLMGWIVSNGIVSLDDIAMVPYAMIDTSELAAGRPRKAVMEGNGIFRTNAFRFGGEERILPWRIRRTKMAYLGVDLFVEQNTLASILSHQDAMSSCGLINVIEIYDAVPAQISLTQVIANGPVTGARSFVPFNSSLGIWIDSISCPKSTYLDPSVATKGALQLQYDGEEFGCLRLRTSADPESVNGEDVTAQLQQYWVRERGRSSERTGAPRKNAWIVGTAAEYDPTLASGVIPNSIAFSADTSTGYPLRTATSIQSGTGANLVLPAFDAANPNGWGGGLPAGRYTLSYLVRANWAGEINFALGYGTPVTLKAEFTASTRFQRVGFTFFHDGAAKQLTVGVFNFPGTLDPTGPGIITIGLPLIQAGDTIGEWTLPSQNAMVSEDLVRASYCGSSTTPPATGRFRPGDTYEVFPPVAGAPRLFVCTANPATSPVWKTAEILSS